jgi:hypothetical protein
MIFNRSTCPIHVFDGGIAVYTSIYSASKYDIFVTATGVGTFGKSYILRPYIHTKGGR